MALGFGMCERLKDRRDPSFLGFPCRGLERFLERERHLPDVPSAAEMVSNGLDVAKSDALLLKQIEETYLHMIQLAERMSGLEKENEELRVLVGKP